MNRLKDLRQAFGWTQSQLGEKVGLAKTTISGYESEAHFLDPPTICALCDIFDCSADYLLCRSDVKKPELSDDEFRMVEAFRAADPDLQELILRNLKVSKPAEIKRGVS